MADAHPERHSGVHPPDVGGRDAATGGMPRWVKLALIVGVTVVLLVVVAKLTGFGGDHGPGRHGGGETPSSIVEEDGAHRSPVDHGP